MMNHRWIPQSFATLAVGLAALGLAGCGAHPERPVPKEQQVVFVCQHGNVKSLMAALYFNEAAKEHGLHVHAISRAAALDSDAVPPAIAEGLRRDGFDVSTVKPTAFTESDVPRSRRVVLINTELPVAVPIGAVPLERWNDVPAASVDFAAARDALRRRARELVEELDRREDRAHGPRAATGAAHPSD